MAKTADPLAFIRDFVLGLVRREGPDLTARQLSIFLVVYREDALHTVRDLADRLDVPRGNVTRSVDRLEELDLLKREPDPRDRRSILLARTTAGAELVGFMTALIEECRHATASGTRRLRLPVDA